MFWALLSLLGILEWCWVPKCQVDIVNDEILRAISSQDELKRPNLYMIATRYD